MSIRKYPPLTPSDVIKILLKQKFVKKNQSGSHMSFEGYVYGKRRIVTVDVVEKEFGVPLMKSMISQSGLSRKEFYSTLKKTAKKIQ